MISSFYFAYAKVTVRSGFLFFIFIFSFLIFFFNFCLFAKRAHRTWYFPVTVFCGSFIVIHFYNFFSDLFNIAWKKTATQSSTYKFYEAVRVIDGVWDPDLFTTFSCSHTIPNNEAVAWLEIDLHQTFTIRRIKILNRLTGEEDWTLFHLQGILKVRDKLHTLEISF